MDFKETANKLKEKIKYGELTLDNSVIKQDCFAYVLQYFNNDTITLTLDASDITATDKEMSIKGGIVVFGISAKADLQLVEGDNQQVDCTFSSELNGLTFPKMAELKLIPIDIYNPLKILPKNPFDHIKMEISSKTFSRKLRADTSNNKITLLKQIGLSITDLGFALSQTVKPGSKSKDTQLSIFGTFVLGKTDLTVNVTIPISRYSTKNQWNLTLSSKTTLAGAIQDITQLFLGYNIFEYLPPGFSDLLSFAMEKLQINFDPMKGSIKYIKATISNPDPFTIAGVLKIKQAGLTLSWSKGTDKSSLSALIFGKFQVGDETGSGNVSLDVSMSIPSGSADWVLDISGALENKGFLDLYKALPGSDIGEPPVLPKGLSLDKIDLKHLKIAFNPSSKKLSKIAFDVDTQMAFPIVPAIIPGHDPFLSLENPYADFDIVNPLSSANRELTGKLGGYAVICKTLNMQLQAAKPAKDQGWRFTAGTAPGESISLRDTINAFLREFDTELPEWLPADLKISELELAVQTAGKKEKYTTYSVQGKTEWELKYEGIIDSTIFAQLEIKYDKNASADKPFSGVIKGGVKDIPLIGSDLELGYKFAKDNKELYVQWRALTGKLTENKDKQKIIQIEIGDESIGSLIAYMVGLVTNNKDFQLDEPWSLLNQISLKGFKLSYNFSTQKVSVSYTLPQPIDLVFLVIDGLTLKTENGEVLLTIDGHSYIQSEEFDELLGKSGKKGSDVQNLPGVPGKGNKYFDLRLLALGQHVSMSGVKDLDSIDAAITAMRNQFKEPAPGSETVPIGPGGAELIKFNPDSHWLFGTNFGIMKSGDAYTVDLAVIFNDPELYGLRLKLDGEYAKVFKGLDLEVMYKKITDSIGMFKAELTLPDSIRYLTFGEVNFVLPVIGIEICTNGDFKIDLGFPYDLDFSRSFAVSGIVWAGYVPLPLMGLGGIYFGKLSGPTSSQVPKTTKGLFNPVLELGVGLQVGFGYVFAEGPLKAGFDVGIVGVIEGVLAKYSPYNPTERNSRLPLPAATNALTASDVGGDYYYKVKGTLGLQGRLYGSVDFSVISASFSVTVYVVAKAALEAYRAMTMAIAAGVKLSLSVKIDLGLFSVKLNFSFSYQLQLQVSIGSDQHTLAPWYDGSESQLYRPILNSALNAAPLDLKWKPIKKEPGADPITLDTFFVPNLNVSKATSDDNSNTISAANYAAVLFMDGNNGKTASTAQTSFGQLAEDVFRWAVYAGMSDTDLTRSQLDQKTISMETLQGIFKSLTGDALSPISYGDIADFLKELYIIHLQLLSQNTNKLNEENQLAATLFPVIPELILDVPSYKGSQAVNRDFKTYNPCDDAYLRSVKEYFQQLAVQVGKETGSKASVTATNDEAKQSFATYVFGDYFLLMARQLIQKGIDILKGYQYDVQPGDSLDSIVNRFNAGGNDAVSAAGIVTDNATAALTTGKPLWISGCLHTTAVGNSLLSIARTYGLNIGVMVQQNDEAPDLFIAGKTVHYYDKTYLLQDGDTLKDIAAHFNVGVADLVKDAETPGSGGRRLNPFPSQTDIVSSKKTVIIAAGQYQVTSGDSLASIAAAYGIADNDMTVQNQDMPGILVPGVEIQSGSTVHVVKTDDTFTTVAGALKISLSQLSAIIKDQTDILQTLAFVLVPPISHTVATGDTFRSIVDKYLVSLESIALNYKNRKAADLFDGGQLAIPNLEKLRVKDILDRIISSDCISHLSGMSSRYHLHGLRLPVDKKKTFNLRTAGVDSLDTQQEALYNLTGQQFPLPGDVTPGTDDNYKIYLKKPGDVKWISFNGTGDSLILEVTDPNEIDRINRVAKAGESVIPVVQSLAPIDNCKVEGAHYAFKSVMKWQAGQEIEFPGDKSSPSLPMIWNFSDSLANVLSSEKQTAPAFSIKIGQHNQTTAQLEYARAKKYRWSTIVNVTIRKNTVTDQAATDPSSGKGTAYEITGTDEKGIALLESLLVALKKGGNTIIDQLRILYSQNAASQHNEGLQSDGNDNIVSFITQSNLSTETNPPANQLIAAGTPADESLRGILNEKGDFIRLLWQCSIVRSGGYSLYYNVPKDSIGLPDHIFNEDGTGTIYLLVTYNEPLLLSPYMNSAVTGDNINLNNDVVFALSEAQTGIQYKTTAADTLATIANPYHISISRLAQLNETKPLCSGIEFQLRSGTYTTVNGDTFQTISQKTGTGISGIVNFQNNPDIPGVFPENTLLDIVDQITHKTANVSQGNMGFRLERENPGEVPDIKDKNYAGIYLQNLYGLLSYGLAANNGFKSTIKGLPVGPLDKTDTQQDQDILEANRLAGNDSLTETAASGKWVYEQIIPVSRYASFNPIPKPAYPGEHPAPEDNPYAGIGQYTSFDYEWVDFYGNINPQPFSTGGTIKNSPSFVGYTDELLSITEWPSTGVEYTFGKKDATAGTVPQLKISFNFDTSRYDDPETGKENATKDLETYAKLYYQLNQKDEKGTAHVSVNVTTSLRMDSQNNETGYLEAIQSFVLSVYQYLYKRVNASAVGSAANDSPGLADIDITKELTMDIVIDHSPQGIFKDSDVIDLDVSVGINRLRHLIDDNFLDAPAVNSVLTHIKPQTRETSTNANAETPKQHALKQFARNFETIFNGTGTKYLLKIATGLSKNTSSHSGNRQDIRVVRLGTDTSGGIYYHIKNGPAFYAPRPLSNQLEARDNVPFYRYQSGQGIDFGTITSRKNFSGIDMDGWGRRFLDAVDLFLSPEFAEPAFIIDQLNHSQFLKDILNSKGQLAEAIRDHVVNILEKDAGRSSDKVAAAREKLYQQLLIELSNAYTVDAVVQYDADVSGKFQTAAQNNAPRFFGKPLINSTEGNADDNRRGYSLSTAKLPFPQDKQSALNFVFSTKAAKEQRDVSLDLDYQISHLEYEIQTVTELAPYEISSWLSFVIPDDSLKAAVGKADIPVPLRAYPKPPSLLSQQGVNSAPGGKSVLENATNWDYTYTYSVDHAAQDIIDSEIRLNLEESQKLAAAEDGFDLFQELAEFSVVYSDIKEDFTQYLQQITADTQPSDPAFEPAAKAVQAFREIITRVAQAWKTWDIHSHHLSGPGDTTSTITFKIKETETKGNSVPAGSLLVTLSDFNASGKIAESLNIEDQSIAVRIDGYTAEPYPNGSPGISFVYKNNTNKTNANDQYLTYHDAMNIPERTVAVEKLNILQYQNALSSVSITRNENLIDGEKTNKQFIYQTPSVQFANRLIPLLNYGEEIDISKLDNGKNKTLEEYLSAFFKAFLNKGITEAEVKLECRYRYPMDQEVVQGKESASIVLPVLFATPFTFKIPQDFTLPQGKKGKRNANEDAFVSRLSTRIREWVTANKPLTENARLLFDISVFSQLNGNKMPLIRLSNVICPECC